MTKPRRSLPLCVAEPALFSRPWGGTRLVPLCGENGPETAGEPIGEAWLLADHPECESFLHGPHGTAPCPFSLRDWMREAPEWLLGTCARPTPGGRFPLLLKLIDAASFLSVQVHPDDEAARELGEPDPGKTEMWTFLDVAPNAVVIAGIREGVPREAVRRHIREGSREIERCLLSLHPRQGDSLFIPAGMLHAIGPGLLLAEIQQNSNITYRVYDWDRRDGQGNSRPLHPEQSLAALKWGLPAPRLTRGEPLRANGDAEAFLLAECPYFRAERLKLHSDMAFSTGGKSFHVLLNPDAPLRVRSGGHELLAPRAHAVLIAAGAGSYSVEGPAALLRYYVPGASENA